LSAPANQLTAKAEIGEKEKLTNDRTIAPANCLRNFFVFIFF